MGERKVRRDNPCGIIVILGLEDGGRHEDGLRCSLEE